MAVRFIRQPSETPNISNADDARMIRYAYGGYDGYIKDKGAEVSHDVVGSIFRINSGVINLQGYETEIDANGWEMSVNNVATQQHYIVFLETNLSTQTSTIKSFSDYGTPPPLPSSDNLTRNSTGVARLLLYTFTTLNGAIFNTIKVIKEMVPGKAQLAEQALYASADISKGTIEDRLTALGFKQGTITNMPTGFSARINLFKRQGNYIGIDTYDVASLLTMQVERGAVQNYANTIIGTVPLAFHPQREVHIATVVFKVGAYYNFTLTLKTNGEVILSGYMPSYTGSGNLSLDMRAGTGYLHYVIQNGMVISTTNQVVYNESGVFYEGSPL